jgi:hypothetical protein
MKYLKNSSLFKQFLEILEKNFNTLNFIISHFKLILKAGEMAFQYFVRFSRKLKQYFIVEEASFADDFKLVEMTLFCE